MLMIYPNWFRLAVMMPLLCVSSPDDPALTCESCMSKRVVIAHRGASGYLPEHTLAATVMAFGMGADFIEQDVVLTKDEIPIVVHDIVLDAVTDVAARYPKRARPDGRYYALDFTLAEIKTLVVNERINLETGRAVFRRFPSTELTFRVPTLAESIQLVQGLNQSHPNRSVGIYPEIKKPSWHRQNGSDISVHVLDVLREYGYDSPDSNSFLQCFDAVELQRIRHELGWKSKLIQLIGSDDWNETDQPISGMVTPQGLAKIAEYADGVGPWMPYLWIESAAGESEPVPSDLVAAAHQRGLVVHPFTLRADVFPDQFASFEDLLRWHWLLARVDGIFTDHPDVAVLQRDRLRRLEASR